EYLLKGWSLTFITIYHDPSGLVAAVRADNAPDTMQTSYPVEGSYLNHNHLLTPSGQGSPYPYGYHGAGFGEASGTLAPFAPAGYSGVAAGAYVGADAAAAAADAAQQQAYALPLPYNYASPFTAALTAPLLNAVQSSLVSASSTAATEGQQPPSSSGQPSGLWPQDNASSNCDNGFLGASALQPRLQHPP
ncbi:hypothetical protein Agub_g6284, partial [Astrephomene gubernaculifera]